LQHQNDLTIALSIVVPARNEEYRLTNTIETAADWCRQNALNCEIVIVENASTDSTLDVVENLSVRFSNVRHLRCPKRGKGNAVRAGILASKGRCVMFMDADGAALPVEIDKLVTCIENGCDIAIGSRLGGAGTGTVVTRSRRRAILSQLLNAVLRPLIPSGISDAMCGFKMFRQEAARQIFSILKIGGWAFDIEALYLAKMKGFTVTEVPISWEQQAGSSVGLFLDPIKILIDAARVPFLHRRSSRRLRSDVDHQ